MGYTYKENGFEIRNPTNYHYVCFILHNYCEKSKVYIDEEGVKSQIKIHKKNEENYKNVPDTVFSFDCGEGTITRKTITQYIKDCS